MFVISHAIKFLQLSERKFHIFVLALLKESRCKHASGDSISSVKRYRFLNGKRHRSGEMSTLPEPTTLPSSKVKVSPNKSETVSDGISQKRKYAAVAVLFFINLLNYMDRYTIAGKKTFGNAASILFFNYGD